MRTVITETPAEAAAFIRNGGLVAFPTETVYGLGASVFDETAIKKIFEAKQRPDDNPLIVHIGELEQLRELGENVDAAMPLIRAFFPGPLTVVVKKAARVPLAATAGLDTIGVRMPSHHLAREFLRACGTPVAAPSANLSGRPSPTTWQAVLEDLDGRIDCILKGQATEIGLESTVVDCTADPPVILRPGAVSLEMLSKVVPGVRLASMDPLKPVKSPGTRHAHYKPRASVVLIDDSDEIPVTPEIAGYIGLEHPAVNLTLSKVCSSVEEYASSVFAFFRDCEAAGIQTIYCQTVATSGIGAGLMDRLRRAAS